LELERNNLNQEISILEKKINDLKNERMIQSSFVDRILTLQITETNQQIDSAKKEILEHNQEYNDIDIQLSEISKDLLDLNSILSQVTSEVEATSKIFEQHQITIRQYDRQLEQLSKRISDTERRIGQFIIEKEKTKLQIEQRLEELARIGFSDKIKLENLLPEQVERMLTRIKQEKRGLGAINQLAVDHYHIIMREYKQRSMRINGMEEEKLSILNFIDEIEREKQEHFMLAYNQICENFSNIFSKITGGGDGRRIGNRAGTNIRRLGTTWTGGLLRAGP